MSIKKYLNEVNFPSNERFPYLSYDLSKFDNDSELLELLLHDIQDVLMPGYTVIVESVRGYKGRQVAIKNRQKDTSIGIPLTNIYSYYDTKMYKAILVWLVLTTIINVNVKIIGSGYDCRDWEDLDNRKDLYDETNNVIPTIFNHKISRVMISKLKYGIDQIYKPVSHCESSRYWGDYK